MLDDAELLRRYADERSEAAFAELVRRRLDLVYSIALRTTGGDAHRAQDAAQRVFTDLARKAAALARRPALTGWLYRSAQFAATDLVRVERRRQAREAAAQRMNEISNSSSSEPNWNEIRPVLDQTLAALNERDRDALLLRFFEALPFAEIAARLRLTEDAARMRVERALEKMRLHLARRGITSTAAALGGALAGQGALAAPTGAASTIASTAITAVATGGLGAAGWFGLFAMSKIKITIASAVLLTGLVTVIAEVRANLALTSELRSLGSGNDALVHARQENRRLNLALVDAGKQQPGGDELARLHARVAQLQARPEGVTDASLRPPQNVGRATAEAANETFCWACNQHDIETVAGMIRFRDDTPENRAAFMAHVSDAVRARYPTPEKLSAAALFGVHYPNPDPPVAMQVTGTQERPGQVRVNIWWRTASGKEEGGGGPYSRFADGWGIALGSLLDESSRKIMLEHLDPGTGDFIPFDKQAELAKRKKP